MPRLLLVLLLSGCVSKGRYELLEMQLGASRAAVSARAGQSAEEQRALEARVVSLKEEIGLRQAQLDQISLERTALLASLSEANATLAALEAQLEGEGANAEVVHRVAAALEVFDAEGAENAVLEAHRDAAVAAFAELVDAGKVTLEVREREVVVRVPTKQLFQEGWTTLSPRGDELVAGLVESLKQLPGRPVRIEGHTDAAPRHSATWPSNWERGFSRAMAVLRQLEAAEVPVILTAASAGGTMPRVAGDDEANRRVELWVDLDPEHLRAFAPSPDAPVEEAPADTPQPEAAPEE